MTIAQQLEQKGFREGFRESFREGIQEASLKIACNLLNNGFQIQYVMQVTELTEEELNQFLNK